MAEVPLPNGESTPGANEDSATKRGPTRQRLRCWVFTIQTNIFDGGEGEGDRYTDGEGRAEWDPWGLQYDGSDWRYCIAGAERCPKTGRYHWQGYAEFNKAMDLVAVKKALDCNYVHLEARRGTQEQAIAYCRKEDTGVLCEDDHKLLFEWGTPARDGGRGKATKNQNYSKVLEMSTYGEAVELLRELEPADYVKFHSSVTGALKKHFTRTKVFIRPAETFTVPLIPADKLKRFAVVITGISGAGKTAYAKAHFKAPLVCSHIDDLKRFDPIEHDGIVFDDMSFAHWPVSSCIHLLDMEDDRSINCRHTCGFIPAWTPRIFTSNKKLHDVFNFKDCNEEEERAIMRRFEHVFVNAKMF